MRDAGDRAGEAATLNGIAYLFGEMHRDAEALVAFEQSIALEQQVANHAGEAAGLVGIALLLYQHLKRTKDAISYMEQAIIVLMETDLPQDSSGRTIEKLQGILQAMRGGVSILGGFSS